MLVGSIAHFVPTAGSLICGLIYSRWTGRTWNPVQVHKRWFEAAREKEERVLGLKSQRVRELEIEEQELRDSLEDDGASES